MVNFKIIRVHPGDNAAIKSDNYSTVFTCKKMGKGGLPSVNKKEEVCT